MRDPNEPIWDDTSSDLDTEPLQERKDIGEHRTIWLEPSCVAKDGEDRHWCKDDAWGACEECGTKSVKYIIASEYEALHTQLTEHKSLREGKKRALAIADERAKESVDLRARLAMRNSDVNELQRQIVSARTALESASTQCGNVIYNCEQRPSDNQRHMDSWHGVKKFIDAALKDLPA